MKGFDLSDRLQVVERKAKLMIRKVENKYLIISRIWCAVMLKTQ